ncbi:MAG: GNAT family N-acetyltransferase [Phycisphaerales bacterium]
MTDKATIEGFLRLEPDLHVYSLGDLDDFFWPQTTWYGREKAGTLREIALVYAGQGPPTVVGISRRPAPLRKLLAEVAPLLPPRFYAHLSPGVEKVFKKTHRLYPHGVHYKMILRDASRATSVECSTVGRLAANDRDDLLRLYDESYPGNWFDSRMLKTEQYFGLRVEGRLVSVAGVHVYSEQYHVAAVGNVVTHPDHRSKGYGTLVTARLCQSLLEKVDHVGLNVKADNEPALACYARLGFEIVAPYGEFTIEKT